MDCLLNYIALRGCGSEDPDSGVYINSLPGINLGLLDKIADDEQINYAGVWTDIQARSARRFNNDVINELRKRFKINSLQESIDLLRYINTTTDQTAAAAKWRGFQAELTNENDNKIIGSALHAYFFQSIQLYRKVALGAITAKIFDLDTGDVLKTITIPSNGSAGWTRVNVNERFLAYRIGVVYDATTVEAVEQDISHDNLNHGCGCGCWDFGGCYGVKVRGIESASLTSTLADDDVTTGNNIYGFSAIFSVECRFDALVCNNKHHFLDPWQYLLGNEIMIERIYSPRKNVFTTVDRKRGEELRDFYQVEYEKKLRTACDGIELNLADCCLECSQEIQIQEGTP